MKLLRTLAFVTLLPTLALAQDNIDIGHIVGGGKMLGGRTADNQTIVPMVGIDSSGNTRHEALSGKTHQMVIGGTPVAQIDSSGQMVSPVQPAVITPMTALTPVAGAALSARVSIMATAAPTLAIVMLPAATSSANEAVGLYNKSASPVLMHNSGVVGTDVINGLGAGTPYSCATGKFCDCRVIGTGSLMCVSQ